MSDSPEVAVAGSEEATTSSLTEAQLGTFWEWTIANGDAARRLAKQLVPKQDVDDVINSSAILFIESFQRAKSPAPFPRSDDEFRGRFLAIVRNHALDCIRDTDGPERPVHSHWGLEPEPRLRGRKIGDRPLDHVFARNDRENYDAPAAARPRDQDDLDKLDEILRDNLSRLPRMQRIVIEETFFEERKRAEVARRHGISVKTYDSHLQAAFQRLRDELWMAAYDEMDDDRSHWYDEIEERSDRYDDRLGLRIGRELIDIDKLRREAYGPEGDDDKNSGAGAA